MSEREKASLGLLYDANYDVDLLQAQRKCKDLCFAFNQLKPSLEQERIQLFCEIIGNYKSILGIHSPFYCDYSYKVSENFYANYGLTILDGAKVTLGDHEVIGSGSVVTKDIPSHVIAVGNPCKVLREITEKDRDTLYLEFKKTKT